MVSLLRVLQRASQAAEPLLPGSVPSSVAAGAWTPKTPKTPSSSPSASPPAASRFGGAGEPEALPVLLGRSGLFGARRQVFEEAGASGPPSVLLGRPRPAGAAEGGRPERQGGALPVLLGRARMERPRQPEQAAQQPCGSPRAAAACAREAFLARRARIAERQAHFQV